MRTLEQLLNRCKTSGWVMICYHSDPRDPDYAGDNVAKAKEALEACDEMYLRIHDPLLNERVGTAFIVNEFEGDPEEQINDIGGERLIALMKEGEDA